MQNPNDIKIERVIMSGPGPKITYKLVYNNKTMFSSSIGSYMAWTRKKDAKLIIERIKEHGLPFVENKLDRKAF